jgi:hypothetical protein
VLERHVALAAVGAEAAGGLRREVEQGADRIAGAPARRELEHLAEQHQGGDHRCRLEVDRHLPCIQTRPEEAGTRWPRGCTGMRYGPIVISVNMFGLRLTTD